MQTFKFSLQSSTSQVTITNFIKELFSSNPHLESEVTIKITEEVEFEDFTGDLHEFTLPERCYDFILAYISGRTLSEVFTSGGDDCFYDYTPDLMNQFFQLLTQAKAQARAQDLDIVTKCIGIYNYLLQYQGNEDDDTALFEDQGLMPME